MAPWALMLPLFVLAAGCDGNGLGCAPTNDRLVVYSGRTEALVAPVLTAFEEETGVPIHVRYADTSQLAAAVVEEGGRARADVFFAQDAGTMGFLAAEGRLRTLPEDLLQKVDPRLRSPGGLWVGTSARARVLTYNPRRVPPPPLPPDLRALTTAPWKDRIGWSPNNVSFQSFVAAFIQLEGEAAAGRWLRAMRANGARDYPSNTALVQAVAAGEIDAALTNHYYLHRLREEHGQAFAAANHYFGDRGAASLVNVSAAGIIEGSRRVEDAQRLIAFLLSERAQSHFAEVNFELPVVPGVTPDTDVPSLTQVSPPALDLASLGGLERAVRLLRETRVLP
jgi:iron(III) transport system substrate-binding protein